MNYDAGDYAPRSTRRMKARRLPASRHARPKPSQGAASCAASASRPTSKPAASRRRRGRLARRRRRPVGIGRSARQPVGTVEVSDRLAQPRPGPRDDLRAARRRAPRHRRSKTSRSSTATPTRCSSAWAPMARARAVGMTAIVKALDKVEAKAKKIAAHLLEASAEGDIVIENGEFKVAGTDKKLRSTKSRCPPMSRPQVPDLRDRAGPEGRRVLRSVQLHLPGGLPHLRGRDRSRHRHHPVS
jgi:hypothetical protein